MQNNSESVGELGRIGRLERMTADYWRQVTRTGGAYIPPKRMAAAAAHQQELPDPSTEAYQRLAWDALRRSLNGLVNKVNASNIREIVVELIGENLVRGRGLLVKAVMKAQAASLPYTSVYAALVSVLNTKFPEIGMLLCKRLIIGFRKGFRRNDKALCLSSVTFMAHLVNQRVLHEICVLQLLMLLLEQPTDDSVEIAIDVVREAGACLSAVSEKPTNAVFERFRSVLQEALVGKRAQYMIEVLFQVRKDGFSKYPAVREELDLVEEEDQNCHYLMLDDDVDGEDVLNVFQADPAYPEKEEEYARLKREILGEEDEEEQQLTTAAANDNSQIEKINLIDKSEAELVHFRKTVYLTIMSSLNFEECGHKLLKLNIPESYVIELCHMIVECSSNEKNYLKFYGLLAERFCRLNSFSSPSPSTDYCWREGFELCFHQVYQGAHKLETKKIRNMAKVFGHLFETDAISWACLECIILTEQDTTSASRILVKFLFQDLAEFYGIAKLLERLQNPDFTEYFLGFMPVEGVEHVRFCINFFTAIDLADLTVDLRARLEALQASAMNDAPSGLLQNSRQEHPYRHHPPSPPQSMNDGENLYNGDLGHLPPRQDRQEGRREDSRERSRHRRQDQRPDDRSHEPSSSRSNHRGDDRVHAGRHIEYRNAGGRERSPRKSLERSGDRRRSSSRQD